jgi:hypothetical protein
LGRSPTVAQVLPAAFATFMLEVGDVLSNAADDGSVYVRMLCRQWPFEVSLSRLGPQRDVRVGGDVE